jgi:hypothetical protein
VESDLDFKDFFKFNNTLNDNHAKGWQIALILSMFAPLIFSLTSWPPLMMNDVGMASIPCSYEKSSKMSTSTLMKTILPAYSVASTST